MTDASEPLRAVSWRDLCPWLIIFRAYRLAVRLPMLLLATVAVLLTPLGWRLSETMFLRDDDAPVAAFYSYPHDPGNLHRWPIEAGDAPGVGDFRRLDLARRVLAQKTGEIASVFHGLVDPFRLLFFDGWTLAQFAFFLFGALWTLAVWAFFGGALTRLAVVPLAAEPNTPQHQHFGLRAALRHALRKFPAYFLAPLFPLLGVLIFGALLAIFGLLLRMGDLGLLVAGGLWIVVLLGGLAMAYILLGLLFGWPLMWVAASAERDADFFESVSRGYSYARQAPLRYLFYVLVAALFGGLCWLLVQLFAEAVLALGEWGVAWGAGHERVFAVRNMAAMLTAGAPVEFASTPQQIGVTLIAAWTGLARAVAAAFAFSFFWCAYCAIYLLLRLDVDHREMDEVWLEQPLPIEPPTPRVVSPDPK